MNRDVTGEGDSVSVSHEPSTSKNSYDVLLMIFGSIGAAGNGLSIPLMTLLFGDLIDSFGENQNNKDIVDVISKVCVKFVYLGLGTLAAAFLRKSIITRDSRVSPL
ncbi:unnamed protein product [Arabis nemorensis]|uniref:ABC transmembrane type-1 domain-containing protein n=1 Tax=Arabis nemorensis TaxID=586526 RepID=A0A565AL50_9BRAS|nr:unnamed protein product [Arabis nemorensis]